MSQHYPQSLPLKVPNATVRSMKTKWRDLFCSMHFFLTYLMANIISVILISGWKPQCACDKPVQENAGKDLAYDGQQQNFYGFHSLTCFTCFYRKPHSTEGLFHLTEILWKQCWNLSGIVKQNIGMLQWHLEFIAPDWIQIRTEHLNYIPCFNETVIRQTLTFRICNHLV